MDLKVLNHAKDYIEALAKGTNPLTGESVDDNDIVNNIKISRCLFYVKDILEEVLRDKKKKVKLLPFAIEKGALVDFEYSKEPITLSEIINRINKHVSPEREKLKYKVLSEWLISIGVLQVNIENEKKVKRPTNIGINMGIITEQRFSVSRNTYYTIVLFEKRAQEFIIDNFENFLDYLKKETM